MNWKITIRILQIILPFVIQAIAAACDKTAADGNENNVEANALAAIAEAGTKPLA
jgi:hypothetical protein